MQPDTMRYHCRMAFGSNGIYVGGKDTFISELSGNWAVHGELAGASVTGAPGTVGRITVELGSTPPSSLAKYAILFISCGPSGESLSGTRAGELYIAMTEDKVMDTVVGLAHTAWRPRARDHMSLCG